MICVPVERVKVEPFEETGAFYSVSLKRVNSPLKEFQLGENGILSASQLLKNFREEVKKSIKETTGWCHKDSFLVWVFLFDPTLGLEYICNADKINWWSRDDKNMFLPFCFYQNGRWKERRPGALQ